MLPLKTFFFSIAKFSTLMISKLRQRLDRKRGSSVILQTFYILSIKYGDCRKWQNAYVNGETTYSITKIKNIHIIGFCQAIKQVWATVWTFLARIRSFSMIIVECFNFIKFALNKASKTKSVAVSEIMKSAFENKDVHTTQTCGKRRLR